MKMADEFVILCFQRFQNETREGRSQFFAFSVLFLGFQKGEKI